MKHLGLKKTVFWDVVMSVTVMNIFYGITPSGCTKNRRFRRTYQLCVTVEGSPRVRALPFSSSSAWPEMSHNSNPVSLLPHRLHIKLLQI
jgi:hypothetical protein